MFTELMASGSGGGLTFEKIWTNPNPSANVPTNTYWDIDMSQYDAVLVGCQYNHVVPSALAWTYLKVPNPKNGYAADYIYCAGYYRRMTITTSQMKITNNGTAGAGSTCVPSVVYGIKGDIVFPEYPPQ